MSAVAAEPRAMVAGTAARDTMTARERWRAALHRQPLDRLPFWPKIGRAYVQQQVEPYASMSVEEVHGFIGSERIAGAPNCVRHVSTNCSLVVDQRDNERTTVFATPVGELRRLDRFDRVSQSWHPVTFPVSCVEDVKVMVAYYRDLSMEVDKEALARARQVCAAEQQDAITWAGLGTSPLMSWVEWIAGIENAHLLLLTQPDEVGELFDAMHAVLRRTVEIACDVCPADVLDLSENTSTTLISPDQYREHCFRHISEYARVAREAGRDMNLHMCGHLEALLPMLDELGVRSFEAFTSPPVGNTRLLDGRLGCPDVCLIGGTNAALWTLPAERILTELERDLDALPHHRGIVVTSGGMMPPLATPDTIRRVCEFVKQYPLRGM